MKSLPFALLLLLVAGCVSFEYQGVREAEPSKHVTVYTDSAKLPQPYQVLGTATVSGNYQSVTREKLIAKLRSEALAYGADALLMREQQILPGRTQTDQPLFNTAFDYDDTERSWRMLYRDVNLNYNNPRNTQTTVSYRRVIRAEFIKFGAPANSEAETEK